MSLTTTLRPRVLLFLALAFAAYAGGMSAPVVGQTSATVFEGARLINGTGGPTVENSAFLVEGTRITQVGRAGQLKAPAGAMRVSLAGKTVIPAIVDTHTHLSSERPALEEQLRGKAYYGVAAAMSLGQDVGQVGLRRSREPHPWRRALPHGRTRPHHAGAGPLRRAVLGQHRGRGSQGRAGAGRQQSGHREDLGGRPGRQVQEDAARDLRPRDRRGAQAEAPRHGPHLQPVRRQGAAEGRARRLRARRARHGHRRGVPGHGQAAPQPGARAEPARPRREDRPELAEGQRARGGAGKAADGGRSRQPRGAAGVRHPGPQPREDERGGRARGARHRRRACCGRTTWRWPTWWRPG